MAFTKTTPCLVPLLLNTVELLTPPYPEEMTSSFIPPAKLKEILEFSIGLAREAGKLIAEGSEAILRSSPDAVDVKKNSVDLVTQYDKAIEELVRQRTSSAYPTFGL